MTTVTAGSHGQVYTDLTDLHAIKTIAKQDYDRGLDEASKQIEAVFLQMVLKSMQQATSALKSDLLDSNEGEHYMDMYCQQLGLTLGQNKALGLADLVKQQLQFQQKTSA